METPMRKFFFVFALVGTISGCGHMANKPHGGFMLFRKLRNPANKDASPPTLLPNSAHQPAGFAPPPGAIIPGPTGIPPGVVGSISPGTQSSISQKPNGSQGNSINLLKPETLDNIPGKTKENVANPTKEPPIIQADLLPKDNPLDIPSYAAVTTKIATGLLPFPDGIDWLKSSGFKSVLFLHEPGGETKAIELLFQKRGIPLTLQPLDEKTLAKENFKLLLSHLEKTERTPQFVFDLDGNQSTGFWYLFFRKSQGLSEETALKELSRLGLSPNRNQKAKTLVQLIENAMKQ